MGSGTKDKGRQGWRGGEHGNQLCLPPCGSASVVSLSLFCWFVLLVTLVLRLFLPLASLLLPPRLTPTPTRIIICKNPRARYGQKSRLEAEVTEPRVATAIMCSLE